jgi:hypothetical protein
MKVHIGLEKTNPNEPKKATGEAKLIARLG